MKPVVYLAGPITGQTSAGAKDWRAHVDGQLWMHGITVVSPVRGAPKLGAGETYAVVYDKTAHATSGSADAIRAKTKTDVMLCSVILAYMPKPSAWPSIGTIIEIARGKLLGKTVILVVDEDEPRLAQHPLLLDCADAVFHDLPTAVDYVVSLLQPYCK